MNQNPPLTAEEAKQLTFPCLLEVWDFKNRSGHHALISHITQKGHFVTPTDVHWHNAALPSPEISEAMRKQFAPNSEFPKRMLVWNDGESEVKPRIVLADLGEKAVNRYIVVPEAHETKFRNGENFSWSFYKNAKPIPETDPISQEIAELEKRIAELKSQQQSK